MGNDIDRQVFVLPTNPSAHGTTEAIYDDNGDFLMNDGVSRDITEKKALEAQLRHAQKMEAVGQLAGGIAHDFNNILTAIIGYGNLLHTKLEENNLLKHYVDQILSASERASKL
ncbi:MAG: histidine kinase dimerization/phospho-acceptor domain-containing protein, partial [Nitrospirota bacterium]